MIPEVSVQELKRELDSVTPPILIDVREADELEISHFPVFIHIPMSQIPSRRDELVEDADLVIVCRSGSRSGRITNYLLSSGYTRVRNLAGGINAWAAAIDPSLPQY